MDIKEVEQVFGIYRGLVAPRHVFFTSEKVTEETRRECVGMRCQSAVVRFMGLQPKKRSDVIILTPDARRKTIIHEAIHANLGLGELLSYPMASVMIRKCKILHRFPSVLNFMLKHRQIKYETCPGCDEFAKAHADPRFIHYVRVK